MNDRMLFADGSRFLYSYDGTDFEDHNASEVTIERVRCVAFFFDRVFVGHTRESSTWYRQRIRWSSTASPYTSFASADYLDLPYGQGAIRRLVPNGNLLIAYLEDKIYLGRRTNMADLPVIFEEVNTGGIGLVGTKAVCQWLNGHFFVGQDSVYYMDSEGKIEDIGSPVVRETVQKTREFWRVYAVPDPSNERILFGFPISSTHLMDEIWAFDYRARAWSYIEYSCTSLSSTEIGAKITWENIYPDYIAADNWTSTNVFENWAALTAFKGVRSIYFGQGKKIYRQETSGSEAVAVVIETGDYDLDQPFRDKTFLRFGIKLEEPPSGELTFLMRYSTDRGRTWRGPRTMTIGTGDDETSATFRATGSIIRFRVSSSSDVASYTISEMTLKYRLRGWESNFD
jgi:hypothetical protein